VTAHAGCWLGEAAIGASAVNTMSFCIPDAVCTFWIVTSTLTVCPASPCAEPICIVSGAACAATANDTAPHAIASRIAESPGVVATVRFLPGVFPIAVLPIIAAEPMLNGPWL
jgi:hypothetical protein